MPFGISSRRLLLVAPAEQRARLLLALVNQDRWKPAEADSLEQARFVLQVQACDLIMVDGDMANPDQGEGLAWLRDQVAAPVVVVGDAAPERIVEALRLGALWIPGAAVDHPGLFSALIEQAVGHGDEQQQAAADRAALRDAQAHVDRLLELLWEAVPGDGPVCWFTQHYMLERLDEEAARCQRYGSALAILLGERRATPGERLHPEQAQYLANQMTERIARSKRRCDVAGQYGLHGFMLLLPQATTAEALGACNRLRGVLAHPPHAELPPIHACFGIASLPGDTPSVQGLLRRAEERLEQERGEETP
jgi:diguanylate cyclase (GGDEF)-like protein